MAKTKKPTISGFDAKTIRLFRRVVEILERGILVNEIETHIKEIERK